MKRLSLPFNLTLPAFFLLACGSLTADVITDWNSELLQTFADLGSNGSPTHNSRALAMTSAAVFDAVNSVNRNYSPYASYYDAGGSASMEAAAAQAAYSVMNSLYGSTGSFGTTYSNLLNSHLSTIPDGTAKTNGVSLGNMAASAILTSRASDGWNAPATYSPQPAGTPGAWQPEITFNAWGSTTGTFLDSEWGYVTPFAMTSGSQFRPVAAPALTSSEYTTSFNEVKTIGDINSTTRTADQTNIAYFWVDGPGTASPPGHWNRIAQTLSASAGLSLEENARLFALLNIAQMDTGIATWDSRRFYDFWRPITAIQQADIDGNIATIQDGAWEPLIPTPSFPGYNSGHSAFSAAGAELLALYFGTDAIAFSSTSESPFLNSSNNTRSFSSLSEAAEEAGRSRIYGGIHYEFENQAGQQLGQDVAQFVFGSQLAPVPEPSAGLLVAVAAIVGLRRRR
jgi:hypothetical protein